MRDITPAEKLILEKEADKIGGMIVLIQGEPGAGKTMALGRMIEIDLKNDRTPLWAGQKSCQWIIPAAQDIPVTIWIHESIKDWEFYLTGSRKDNISKTVVNMYEQESIDVRIKEYNSQEELVDNLQVGRLNVYYLPGYRGDEKEKYFFQKKNLELAQALNNREYGDHISWNVDEVHNVAPDMRKKPFHEIQMQMFPSEWQDFRKNNVSMRGTAHGYGEINWKFYNLKANGIIYMQGGRVHDNHNQINQSAVNSYGRREWVVPGWEKGRFKSLDMPHEVVSWFPDSDNVRLRMNMDCDIPDVRPEPEDVKTLLDDSIMDGDDFDELIGVSEAEELLPWTRREIRRKLSIGDLPGLKVNKKWVLSEWQLLNDQDIPIKS